MALDYCAPGSLSITLYLKATVRTFSMYRSICLTAKVELLTQHRFLQRERRNI